MPKVDRAYREARRAQLLAAAGTCFARDGFHATTMRDIFAEAGFSSGAFYPYFRSKQEIVAAIAEEGIDGMVAGFEMLARECAGLGPGALLARALQAVRDREVLDKNAAIAVLSWAESLRDPKMATMVRRGYAAAYAAFAQVLAVAHTDTALVERLAHRYVAAFAGGFVQVTLSSAGQDAVEAVQRASARTDLDGLFAGRNAAGGAGHAESE